ncbi:uncharacterized protein F5891DRAFT_1073632 [Suillus fuscotomentosus]|uniref:Uncharacterized protein n=1 Tax=Suillus fuscotomentosus TaxID=1912939 RepID=A0AAD4DQ26_9AGAM|nr:uncharacterized protein F5891DRAFT_1073632 [Suillus fuscotomentosus]KAG1889102.1 hypothetical protein F5891DRAFT_1073632 [Suillus fuscotomentosus]
MYSFHPVLPLLISHSAAFSLSLRFWLGTAHVTTQSAFLSQQSLAVLHLSPSGLQAGTRLAVTDIIDAVNAIIMAGKKKRIVCLGWYDLFYIINKVWQNGYAQRTILWDSGEPIPSSHFVGVAIPAATEFCLCHDSPVTRL